MKALVRALVPRKHIVGCVRVVVGGRNHPALLYSNIWRCVTITNTRAIVFTFTASARLQLACSFSLLRVPRVRRLVSSLHWTHNAIVTKESTTSLGVERVSTAVPLCANVSRRVEFPCVSISPGRTNETETV